MGHSTKKECSYLMKILLKQIGFQTLLNDPLIWNNILYNEMKYNKMYLYK